MYLNWLQSIERKRSVLPGSEMDVAMAKVQCPGKVVEPSVSLLSKEGGSLPDVVENHDVKAFLVNGMMCLSVIIS